MMQAMKDRFSKLTSSEKQLLPIINHVDLNMFGNLPLRLYQLSKDKNYLDLGLPYADIQWVVPENAHPECLAGFDKICQRSGCSIGGLCGHQ